MKTTIGLCTLVIAIGALTSVAVADSLYRCSDGTFTNRVERKCAPYESKEVGRIQVGNMRTDQAKPSVADVKLSRGSERDSVRPHPAH